MAIPSVPWPTLTAGAFEAEQGTWSESPEPNETVFSPEVGPPKRRRRTYLPTKSLQFDIVMTSAQLSEFMDFYDVDLVDGIGAFSAVDPRLQLSRAYTFRSPPTIRDNGHDLWKLTFQLRRLD